MELSFSIASVSIAPNRFSQKKFILRANASLQIDCRFFSNSSQGNAFLCHARRNASQSAYFTAVHTTKRVRCRGQEPVNIDASLCGRSPSSGLIYRPVNYHLASVIPVPSCFQFFSPFPNILPLIDRSSLKIKTKTRERAAFNSFETFLEQHFPRDISKSRRGFFERVSRFFGSPFRSSREKTEESKNSERRIIERVCSVGRSLGKGLLHNEREGKS